jgi:cytochrome c oxidase subunit II
MLRHLTFVATLALAASVSLFEAIAADGQPSPWQMDLQPAASVVAEQIHSFNTLLIAFEVGVSVFVLALMGYIMIRFRAKRNPEPSKRSHNSVLEVFWTIAPVLILVIIAIPSLKLLFFMDRTHDADMTLKVVGHQWYWSYEYPDHGDFTFDSLMVPDDELEEGQPRLLAVDEPVVLPIDTDIRILVTSDDVIHAWAVPAFGIKTDTVPGRINETWVRINREGTYYGQCSELCGVNHGFMPIAVEAVSKEAFAEWVEEAQDEYASAGQPVARVAKAPVNTSAQ